VTDGETISITGNTPVRLIGIDTPETVAPGQPAVCYGPEATDRMIELVEGKTVYLEKDVNETDRFDRLLRYVFLPDGQMVNKIMVLRATPRASLTRPIRSTRNVSTLPSSRRATPDSDGGRRRVPTHRPARRAQIWRR
jgi:hypothetical protein